MKRSEGDVDGLNWKCFDCAPKDELTQGISIVFSYFDLTPILLCTHKAHSSQNVIARIYANGFY